jgi:hypothetical protein
MLSEIGESFGQKLFQLILVDEELVVTTPAPFQTKTVNNINKRIPSLQ